LVVAICLLVLVAGAGWFVVRASLPQLDGQRPAPGLSAEASIARDATGSVTIQAANRLDLAYATGYAHGQDRYFQMDLLRRAAAGRLAALVGAGAVPLDRRNRLHQFYQRADTAYAALDADAQRLLQRYAEGVNAALEAARTPPLEYLALAATPQPWRAQDTLLVIDAMYLNLQAAQLPRLLSREALRERLPADLLAFMLPRASHWDATLDGIAPGEVPALPATRPDWLDEAQPVAAMLAAPPTAHAVPPARMESCTQSCSLPATQAALAHAATASWTADLLASAGLDLAREDSGRQDEPWAAVGSSAFAVDAAHGAGGLARLGNDMHLGLGLPNIWYRLTLAFPDSGPAGQTRRISGVSLPGAPVVVAGSNGDVAWGFTNSYGQYMDLVRLRIDPARPGRYQGPDGEWESFRTHAETIEVKGQLPVAMTVSDTRWGPVVESGGHAYALRWVAYQTGAADLGLMMLERARDVPQALHAAQSAGVPTQNILVAGRDGRIGWTLAGPLPQAILGADGFPVSADRALEPDARLPPQAYPRIIDPPGGRLWTGNNTQLGDAAGQRLIGDGGADMGARGTQIRDGLWALPAADEADLLAIQLDDRALWIASWRQLALDTLDEAALHGHPDRAEFRRLIAQWNGRADADAAAYPLLRDLHAAFYDAWFGALDRRLAAGAAQDAAPLSVRQASSRVDAVMEVLAQRHAWIPARHADWRAFVLDRIDTAIARNRVDGAALAQARWGARNRLKVQHAFARFAPPAVRGWLSAPETPMPGDTHMPRVQRPSFGASERFVVAPGHEEQGILHMPGGASGNPFSSFFLAGHEAWVEGKPTPFLPGPQAHLLTFAPQ